MHYIYVYAGTLETHEIGITAEAKGHDFGVRNTLYSVALITLHFKQVPPPLQLQTISLFLY